MVDGGKLTQVRSGCSLTRRSPLKAGLRMATRTMKNDRRQAQRRRSGRSTKERNSRAGKAKKWPKGCGSPLFIETQNPRNPKKTSRLEMYPKAAHHLIGGLDRRNPSLLLQVTRVPKHLKDVKKDV